MTAARRLAAILAADVVGLLAPDGRGRGGDGATPLSQPQEWQLLACRYLHD